MSQEEITVNSELMENAVPKLITSPVINVPHGFSTRLGGASSAPYDSLNLGLSTGDDADKVNANRQRVLDMFAVTKDNVCALEQTHSAKVIKAEPSWYTHEADASVTNNPDLLLVISTADCLPILFYDPVTQAIGAAHAGWRGTVKRISGHVIKKLQTLYDSNPKDIKVVIGPSIQGNCYQVGVEVKEEFDKQGFPDTVYKADDEGRYRLDLEAANRLVLEQAGVLKEHSVSTEHCTHCDRELFYSHRRDALKRGSHWSVIRLGMV